MKPGLVEEIRNMALARSQAGSVGDIAAVMKEAVLWTTRGRNVTEDDLQAMLEGREDLSEVQDNPFAEMMREDDAAEAAMASASAPTPAENTPAADTPAATPSEAVSPAETSPVDAAPAEDVPVETAPAVDVPAEPVAEPVAETPAAAPATAQMSDEEFEAFMKKAQAFYSGQAEENSSNENIAEESGDDDDDLPSIEVHSGGN